MLCGFQSLINKYFKKTSSQKIWFTELYAMVKGNTETKQLYICKIKPNFEVVARSFEIHDKDKILGHQSEQCSLAQGAPVLQNSSWNVEGLLNYNNMRSQRQIIEYMQALCIYQTGSTFQTPTSEC